MNPFKSFNVLDAHVDVITTGEMSGGRTCVVVETSPPGGGPPPHSHQNEDETFYILEGEYEILTATEVRFTPSATPAQALAKSL